MKIDKIANSGNDEWYTPKYAIKPLIKYLKDYKKIWCPFDTEDSNFYKVLSKEHEVITTHIINGDDFFNTYVECDAIISNPPYSLKTEVFERLFYLNKPFAMLVGIVGIFESQRRFQLFKNNNFEMMYFNKRISYINPTDNSQLNPPFSSVYMCHNILPQQIVFENIEKGIEDIVTIIDKEGKEQIIQVDCEQIQMF